MTDYSPLSSLSISLFSGGLPKYFLTSGILKTSLQYEQQTRLPRIESGTFSILRHFRFGHFRFTAILIPIVISLSTYCSPGRFLENSGYTLFYRLDHTFTIGLTDLCVGTDGFTFFEIIICYQRRK